MSLLRALEVDTDRLIRAIVTLVVQRCYSTRCCRSSRTPATVVP